MNKYTPGPWNRNIPPASKYTTIYAGRNTHIARVVTDGLSENEIEGNANLIATAPDMLSALETLLPVAQAFEKQASKGSGGRRAGSVFEKARAAIAKAKGE